MDIITEIMKREGWDKYTNHPADRGGPTKWGITQKAWGDYIGRPATAEDVQAIEEDEARDFYSDLYVLTPGFHRINNEHLRELVIDCGVNHGTNRASRWLQEAAGASVDGAVGPMTLTLVNGGEALAIFLSVLSLRIKFYGRLVTKNKEQAVFAAGWNNRAAGFLDALVARIAVGKEPV